MNLNQLADYCREVRERKRMTVQYVAHHARISINTVKNIESRFKCNTETLERYLNVISIKLEPQHYETIQKESEDD